MRALVKTTGVVLVLGVAVAIAQRGPFPPPRRPTGPLENKVEAVERDGYRYIVANGIPNHPYGEFPNRNNPNFVTEQNHRFRMPLEPKVSRTATSLTLGKFGIAINGVPFDPGAAEFWNRDFDSGWQYEAKDGRINLGLDANNAHVQPNGAYHYHAMPNGLIKKLGGGKEMQLVGYAADGFPIYARYGYADPEDAESETVKMQPGYRLKRGTRPSGPRGKYDGTFVQDFEFVDGTGDLDECNGRHGVTPEFPDGTYHYFITDDFPYIPRKFRGEPDESFAMHGPGRGGPPGGRRPPFRGGRPPFPPPRQPGR